jgi:hypothetical protein
MRLRARIEPGGKTTTRISVPNEVVAALNAGKNGQDSLTKPGYGADACASAEPEVMPVKLVCQLSALPRSTLSVNGHGRVLLIAGVLSQAMANEPDHAGARVVSCPPSRSS